MLSVSSFLWEFDGLVRSGNYNDGVNNIGNNGYLWSSRANSTDNANNSNFNRTNVNPWNNNNKYNGNSVRCVAE